MFRRLGLVFKVTDLTKVRVRVTVIGRILRLASQLPAKCIAEDKLIATVDPSTENACEALKELDVSTKTERDEIHARGPADYVVCGDEDGSCSMDRPCEAREMPGAYKAPEKICSTASSPKPPVPPISRRTGYEMESYVPDGRKLYVVDAENIAGGSDVHPRVAQKMVGSIFSGVPCQADIDHIVVACGITFAKTCFGVLLGHNWPKRPQVLPFASGIDGADIRLIKHLDEVQRIAGRYSQIIIGSGDGIFQTAAISFRAVGVKVGVVSRLSALSNELARAADWVVHIPEPKHELTRGSISA